MPSPSWQIPVPRYFLINLSSSNAFTVDCNVHMLAGIVVDHKKGHAFSFEGVSGEKVKVDMKLTFYIQLFCWIKVFSSWKAFISYFFIYSLAEMCRKDRKDLFKF